METITQTMPQVQQPISYEQCESCAAPVDQAQRYCVVCGTHRRHVRDPAARFHAGRPLRSRSAAAAPVRARSPRSSNLLTALILALIPLAIGLGVLVGRASNNGDSKLLAALANQHAAPSAGSSTTPTATDASTSTLSSTFKLQNGYAVELQTLPGSGTTGASVLSAESSARGKGATDVGLILQKDYKVTPAPPSGSYVIYSGAFKTSAQANQALSKLKAKFPKATVIHVQSSSSVAAAGAGPGKVLARTQYGTANQIAGTKVTQTQLNQGAAIVKHIAKVYGKSYVNSQKNLPSQISVP